MRQGVFQILRNNILSSIYDSSKHPLTPNSWSRTQRTTSRRMDTPQRQCAHTHQDVVVAMESDLIVYQTNATQVVKLRRCGSTS